MSRRPLVLLALAIASLVASACSEVTARTAMATLLAAVDTSIRPVVASSKLDWHFN